MLLSVGVGISFAALNVYNRDFAYILPFAIQMWLFASPLAYSSNLILDNWSWVYKLNPMVGVIDGFRSSFFGTIDFPVSSIKYSIIVSSIIFLLGLILFQRLER